MVLYKFIVVLKYRIMAAVNLGTFLGWLCVISYLCIIKVRALVNNQKVGVLFNHGVSLLELCNN